jgi:hypothetical protein
MKLTLTLDCEMAEGWLAPFVDGLRQGQALASVCGSCGGASFPPRRACPCGGRATAWATLPGTAEVVLRSAGADGDFALVRLDGAITATVARVSGTGPLRLCAATGDRPALVFAGTGVP